MSAAFVHFVTKSQDQYQVTTELICIGIAFDDLCPPGVGVMKVNLVFPQGFSSHAV